jgi:xanthine dehydrogenase YagT iron-sulfur-binding subunit
MKSEDQGPSDRPASGITRRGAVKRGLLLGGTLLIGSGRAIGQIARDGDSAQPGAPARRLALSFSLNGLPVRTEVEARTTLLDLLREGLDHPGTKKGCDHGQCGACTVLIGGRRMLSCLTLAATVEGAEVTTIEGLGRDGDLHPLQTAFVKHDAFQCGFCTPGQLMSAAGFLKEDWPMNKDAIREGMSGNLCRCGAYCGIVAAISEVRGGSRATGA